MSRYYGLIIFFSMATQFDQASLSTDATGKDVVMQVASGIAKGEDEEIFALMKDYPDLIKRGSLRPEVIAEGEAELCQ
jgi:hypothetical protein